MTDTTLSEVTTCRKADLCRLTQLTDQTISNYQKLGMPFTGRGSSQRFNLSECIAWITAYEVKKAKNAKRGGDSESREELEDRMLLAKVQKLEYETGLVMHAMVTVEDAEKELEQRLEPVRSKMLSLPAAWSVHLVGLKDEPAVMDRLTELVYVLMEELSNPITDTGDDEDDDDNTQTEMSE